MPYAYVIAPTRVRKMREMTAKTILIENIDFIVSMDEKRRVIEKGSIYIEKPRIVAVGKSGDFSHTADKIIDGEGKIAIPGLVNTHTHIDEGLLRVVPRLQNAKLYDWIPPLFEMRRGLTPEHIYVAALAEFGELLLTGCTTSSDHYYMFPRGQGKMIDQEIKAAAEVGIRFHPSRGSLTKKVTKDSPPDDLVEDLESVLRDSERLIREYHSMEEFSMCRIALGACMPSTTTLECYEEIGKLATRYEGILLHTHFAEYPEDSELCSKVHGLPELKLLEKVGWLGKNLWLAHAVHLDESEIKTLARTGTGVAHCPTSNMRMAAGVAPVPSMIRQGVDVGLGVDGSASNDTSSMLSELRTCLLANRVAHGADSITATQVLEMATLGGARILHRNELGSIETGKAADLVLINLRQLGYAGAVHDPVAAIVFCGDTAIVDTTIVNGEIVVENGRLVKVDQESLYGKANELASSLVKRAEIRTGESYSKQQWTRAFK